MPTTSEPAPGAARLTVLSGMALALTWASTASAQHAPGCPEDLVRWAEACEGGAPRAQVVACPAGHTIFAVGPGRLRVDVRRSPDAFVTIGELGASPIGEFADWSEAPAEDRAAFDALVRCARARPDTLVDAIGDHPPAPRGSDRAPDGVRASTSLPTPWRALLAGALALVSLIRRFGARGLAMRAMPLIALGSVVLLARRLLVAEAYFHQNGQGPFWVAHGLGQPSNYGPGYAQIFYLAASGAADPDGAVFFLQAALCALVPPAAFAIARGVGAPRTFAWAIALALALSPLLARLAHSESYFATCGALLTLAAAVLATCVRPEADTRANLAGASAAGLLVAQAALIHPLCWLAAAVLPGVVLVGHGAAKARVRLTALSAAVVALVVLAFAGLDLYRVVTGPLGAQWLDPSHGGEGRQVPPEVVLSGVAAVIAIAIAARSEALRRTGLAVAVLSAAFAVSWSGNLLGAAPPWVHHAYYWLYLGVAVGGLAALARELAALAARPADARRERVARWLASGTVLGAALAAYVASLPEATTLPTDAREALLVREWRDRLPEGAVVAHLARAERQIVELPLYDRDHVRFFADRPPADLTAVGRDVFYYRSSVCSTERGREYCEDVERAYVLEPMRRAVLPAVPSMEGLDYDRAEVEVALYRVRDRRSASTTHEGSSEGREGR